MTGLFEKEDKNPNLRETLNKMFGPRDSTSLTLEEQLEQLTEADFKYILSTAAMVKRASEMQKKIGTRPVSYHAQMKSMYPKMNPFHQRLVGDILEQSDPLNIPDTGSKERDAVQQKVLDDYEVGLKLKADK